MLPRRLHYLPILCVLVIGLLTSPLRPFGYVWCLGADGHVELETATAGDCDRAIPALITVDCSAPTLGGDEDDCGSCLDISPLPQWGSTRGRDSDTPANLPALPAPVDVAAFNHPDIAILKNGLVTEDSPRVYELILQHRTTILLI
ncbi:MAG: hypothetical protein ACYC9I_04665 [Desulfuromonadales bacterium]